MKKNLFFVAFTISILSFNSHGQSKIVGEVSNGSARLTLDKTTILNAYNSNLLKVTGIDGKFTDVSIKTTDGTNYFLLFTGTSYKSSLMLTNQAGKLAGGGTSCTTPDCASEPHGCEVTLGTGPDAGTVYCSPCGNGGRCTKTSSTKSLLE